MTFPEEYHAPDLAGKDAVFTVTVKAIKEKELPELDDEFAAEVSEFETLEDYKADIKEKIRDRKKEAANTERENKIVGCSRSSYNGYSRGYDRRTGSADDR